MGHVARSRRALNACGGDHPIDPRRVHPAAHPEFLATAAEEAAATGLRLGRNRPPVRMEPGSRGDP